MFLKPRNKHFLLLEVGICDKVHPKKEFFSIYIINNLIANWKYIFNARMSDLGETSTKRRTDDPNFGNESEGHRWKNTLQRMIYLQRIVLLPEGKFFILSGQILSMVAKQNPEMTFRL